MICEGFKFFIFYFLCLIHSYSVFYCEADKGHFSCPINLKTLNFPVTIDAEGFLAVNLYIKATEFFTNQTAAAQIR